MMGRPTEEMVDNGILVVWTRNGAQIDVMFYFNPTDYGTVCRLSHSKYGYLSKSKYVVLCCVELTTRHQLRLVTEFQILL